MVKLAPSFTAFEGTRRIASGDPADVAAHVKQVLARGERAPVLIFDDRTGRQVEIGFWEEPAEAPAPPAEASRRPGRPKLGVVGREVTLLPRHWDWLNAQPGGASVALRKLVDQARRANESRDAIRAAQESAYRFMSAMAGNEANFEEALRALFAGDRAKFLAMIDAWPIDVRDHSAKLAAAAFA
jgi:hypothetical protein